MSKKQDFEKRDDCGARYLGAYERKQGSIEVETGKDDLQPLLDMAIGALKQGRPPTYAETEEGLAEFKQMSIDYLEYIKRVNQREDATRVIPDIEGWAVFLGITRMTLNTYEKQRNKEWKNFIATFKNCISAAKKQLAFTYKIPPVYAIFDAVNNHNYHNVSEFKLQAEPVKEEVERLSPTDRAERMGLVWDEERQEYIPGKKVREL